MAGVSQFIIGVLSYMPMMNDPSTAAGMGFVIGIPLMLASVAAMVLGVAMCLAL
jgi:hypothetical protein